MVQFVKVGEVELDARRRVSLARLKVSEPLSKRYFVEEGPKGELRLIPVVSVSRRELDVLRDPETMKRINRGLDEAARGDVVGFDPTAERIKLEKKMRKKKGK